MLARNSGESWHWARQQVSAIQMCPYRLHPGPRLLALRSTGTSLVTREAGFMSLRGLSAPTNLVHHAARTSCRFRRFITPTAVSPVATVLHLPSSPPMRALVHTLLKQLSLARPHARQFHRPQRHRRVLRCLLPLVAIPLDRWEL